MNINESILATTVPDEIVGLEFKKEKFGLNEITTYVKSKYFNVEKWIIKEPYCVKNNSFMLVSILNGKGKVNTFDIKKGSHFIVTSQAKTINISGNLEMIVSYLDM